MLTLVSSSSSKASAFSAHPRNESRKSASIREVKKNTDDQSIWPIRFQPYAVKDVALSPQSRSKVRAWLEKALADHLTQGDNPGFRPHILALCGNSGCGKSTLVEALCNEMGVNVVTWSEDSWSIDMKGNYPGSVTSRAAVDRLDEVNDLTTFVRQAAYPQLSLNGMKVESKSQQISKPGDMQRRKNGTKKTNTSINYSDNTHLQLSLENRAKIVLMHDLPQSFTASYSSDASKADDLADLLSSFRDPVVLIVSDIRGADDVQYASRKLIPQSVRDKVTFESIYQNPPTERLMVKGLERILNLCKEAKEALQRSFSRNTNLETFLRELAGSSMGDMRHAVLELGFMASVQLGDAALRSEPRGPEDAPLVMSRKRTAISSRNSMKPREPKRKLARVDGSVVEMLDLTYSSDEEAKDSFGGSSKAGKDHMDVDEDASRNVGDKHRHKISVAVNGKQMSRDPIFSSLHSSGKLIMATLDKDGHFSFDSEDVTAASSMDVEMLFLFVQQNLVDGLINTQRVEQFGQLACPEIEQKGLDEVCKALHYCSDVDTFLHRKYDSNSLHDRSNLNVFPDGYIHSIVARMVGASRGIGSAERVAAGREKGAKLDFIPQRRPQWIHLTTKRAQVASAIACLNKVRLHGGTTNFTKQEGLSSNLDRQEESSKGAPLVLAELEVATSVAPFLSQMYEYQQSRCTVDSSAVYSGLLRGPNQRSGNQGWLSAPMMFRIQELRKAMGAADFGTQLSEPVEVEVDANMDPFHPTGDPLFLESDAIEMSDSDA